MQKTTRFWSRCGEPAPLDGAGYLHAREHWKWLSKSLFQLTDMSAEPCVLLLGEPGMGKSRAIEAHVEELRGHASSNDQVELLRPQFDPLLLKLPELFRAQAQAAPEKMLYLFIDSLDEYLWMDQSAAANLGHLLAQLDAPLRARLRLRISCRTQQLPESLLARLSQLWNSNVSCFELAPLLYEDVARDAESLLGSGCQAFLKELARKRLGGLASRPITLNLLLKLAQNSTLPTTRTDIYAQGCRILCTEPDPERMHITHRAPKQDPARRLALAEYVAALLCLCLKQSIWTGKGPASAPDELAIFDLVECMNQLLEPPLRVTDPELRSLLEDSALFTATGSARSGFSHQTYLEFLTAAWLAKQRLHDSEQLILLSPSESPGQVTQPFCEVAAWLASLREGVMERLSHQQPKLLLRSDLTAANPKWRQQVCSHLLAQYDDQTLQIIDWDVQNYHVLAHPDLAAQLEPFIASNGHNSTVRRVAIHIAHGCRERALVPALVKLALNASEEPSLRESAVRALVEFGDERVLADLRTLIHLPPEEDLNEQIKGMVLSSLWLNRGISPSEVLSFLRVPRQPRFHGSYQGFVGDLARDWPDEALPEALAWVSVQPQRERLTFSFRELLDAFLRRGLQQIADLRVRAALVQAVMARIEFDEDPFPNEDSPSEVETLDTWHPQRRELITALVETSEVPESTLQHIGLGTRRRGWLREGDLDWLLKGLDGSVVEQRARWARLIGDLTHLNQTLDDRVYEASCRYAEMLEALPGDFKPVVLGSEQARGMKEHYHRRQKFLHEQQAQAAARNAENLPRLPLLERIDLVFSYSAKHQEHPWPRLEYALHFDNDGNAKSDPDTYGVIKAEGWTASDDVTRQRILDAAADYLKTTPPPVEPYQYHLNGKTISWHAIHGFRAFQLVLEAKPESLRTIDTEIIARWMTVLMNYPVADAWPQLPQLLGIGYQRAPARFLDALIARFERENSSDGIHMRMGHLRDCWDARLVRYIAEWMVRFEVRPSFLQILLAALLDAQPEIARPLAQSFIPAAVLSPGPKRERAVAAGSVLLRFGGPTGWDTLATAAESDPSFVLNIIEFCGWYDKEEWPDKLPDEALDALYILLRRRYPDLADDGIPESPGADEAYYPGMMYRVRPEQAMKGLRDKLLSVLLKRPRLSSLAALNRVIAEFPHSRTLAQSREWLTEALGTAALSTEMQQQPLERLIARISQLREVARQELARALRTDSEVVGFCLDYFPLVQSRFSDGMDRQQKLRILLEEVDPDELRRCLARFQ